MSILKWHTTCQIKDELVINATTYVVIGKILGGFLEVYTSVFVKFEIFSGYE